MESPQGYYGGGEPPDSVPTGEQQADGSAWDPQNPLKSNEGGSDPSLQTTAPVATDSTGATIPTPTADAQRGVPAGETAGRYIPYDDSLDKAPGDVSPEPSTAPEVGERGEEDPIAKNVRESNNKQQQVRMGNLDPVVLHDEKSAVDEVNIAQRESISKNRMSGSAAGTLRQDVIVSEAVLELDERVSAIEAHLSKNGGYTKPTFPEAGTVEQKSPFADNYAPTSEKQIAGEGSVPGAQKDA